MRLAPLIWKVVSPEVCWWVNVGHLLMPLSPRSCLQRDLVLGFSLEPGWAVPRVAPAPGKGTLGLRGAWLAEWPAWRGCISSGASASWFGE